MTVKAQGKVLSLNDIVQYELPPLFRRQHLNRDTVIGLIGDRGDGKSLGGSIIALFDYMLQNEPCWSNMKIKVVFDIDNAIAGKYGLEGGQAIFESKPLNKYKFLNFDPEYQGGVFFIDEFNIWLADARRAMSNQNLIASDIGQELRKLQSALIYSSLSEMFVENRFRDNTDVYIESQDTALTPEGLVQRRRPGTDFMWTVYPMSRKLTGWRYADKYQTLPPIYFHGKRWWGIIDTLERQKRVKYSVDMGTTRANFEIEEDPAIIEAKSKWDWLNPIAKELYADGRKYIPCQEVINRDEAQKREIPQHILSRKLSDLYNIEATTITRNGKRFRVYELPDEILTATTTREEE